MKIAYERLLSRPEIQFPWPDLHAALEGKKVLITGAGGSIGGAIARGICNSATQFLSIVGHSELNIFNLTRELNKSHVLPAILDIGSEEMRRYIDRKRPDIIIHCAAMKHVGLMEKQPEIAFQTNTEGTISLAKAAMDAGIEKFIFVSTDKAARPEGAMGSSKRLAEGWLLANWKEATITRFGNVLGSSGSLIEIAQKKIEADEPVTLTDRRMTRFVIVPNEAVGLVLTSGLLFQPGMYVLDMGAPVLVEDLIYRLAAQLGKPLSLNVTGAGAGEKLSEDLVNIGEALRPTAHEKIFRIFSNITPGMVAHALGRVREDIGELKTAAQAL